MGIFDHTEVVDALIEQGRIEEASELHNRHVKEEMSRARAGECINLSDLMAAKQLLDEHHQATGGQDGRS